MDLDSAGQKVWHIEAEHAHKQNGQDICCQDLFTVWLDGADATWGNLIELLVDSEQVELAKQVREMHSVCRFFHVPLFASFACCTTVKLFYNLCITLLVECELTVSCPEKQVLNLQVSCPKLSEFHFMELEMLPRKQETK